MLKVLLVPPASHSQRANPTINGNIIPKSTPFHTVINMTNVIPLSEKYLPYPLDFTIFRNIQHFYTTTVLIAGNLFYLALEGSEYINMLVLVLCILTFRHA